MSSPEKEVLKSKICCACNQDKPMSFFYRNTIYRDGFENKCKICKRKKISCRKSPSVKRGRPKLGNAPQLWNVKKQDWVETYEFLKSIGYSLDKNIHEQFCNKYNLKPRKRMYEKSIQYTPQDLGLV